MPAGPKPYVVTLRRAWRESGLTVGQLAARAGVSENTAIAVLSGRNVHLSSAQLVCAVIGVRSIDLTSSTSCGEKV